MGFKRQHGYYLFSKIFNDLKGIVSVAIVLGILRYTKGGSSNIFLYVLSVVVVISLVGSIVSWIRQVYKIEENNIYAKKGAFIIKDISIPFNKVQTIDITSSALQKIFKVCKLQAETSGGKLGEKEFEVIIPLSEALNIKNKVFNSKSNIGEESNLSVNSEESSAKAKDYIISMKNILVASLTSTQITIGFSALFAVYAFLSDKLPEKYRDSLVNATNGVIDKYIGQKIIYKVIFVVSILLLLSLIISFIGMVLKYYNFSLIRHGDSIKIKHGLLTTKEITIPINRILYIDIREGLIRKPLGYCDVKISSFGYGNESGEKAILCPLIKKKELFKLLEVILPEIELNYKINSVSKKSIFTYFIIPLGFDIVICTILSIVFKYGYLSFLIIIIPIYLSFSSYRENGLAFNKSFLYVRIRHIALHTIIVPKKRVQSVSEVKHYFTDKHEMKRLKFEIQNSLTPLTEEVKGIDNRCAEKLISWYKL